MFEHISKHRTAEYSVQNRGVRNVVKLIPDCLIYGIFSIETKPKEKTEKQICKNLW